MPEGHLIHHYAATHARGLVGATSVSSPQGKFAAAARLDGAPLDRVEAVGKHLFYWWGDEVVHVHLGMQGLFLHSPVPPQAPAKQVRLRVIGPELTADLIAPMQCDLVSVNGRNELVAALGPDPLDPQADAGAVWRGLTTRQQSIGAALLDQALVAGVGNVLRAEALHRAGIHPARPAATLSAEEFATLWHVLTEMMREAADLGRIVTAQRDDGGDRAVYKQQTCATCGRPVTAWQLSGRTAYVCEYDQPREPGG